jgi:arginase
LRAPADDVVEIGLLGVPTNSAGRADGVALGPAVLREAGLVDALREIADVTDHGDVDVPARSPERDPPTHLIDPHGTRRAIEGVRRAVAGILDQGAFPLVVGGDCPLLLGCLAALGSPDGRRLLFVDGHEDAYPPDRSPTGEAADMELGFALGLVDAPWWPELADVSPLVRPEGVRILGARDAEQLDIDGVPSLAGTVPIVDGAALALDPEGHTDRAVRTFDGRPWWFHVDLDVLSTEALPAVDYPQPAGLAWDDLDAVAEVALGARPVGWDLTIYNPDLDPTREHARRIVRFVADAAGHLTG